MTPAHDDLVAAKTRLGNFLKASPQLMRSFSEVTRAATAPGTMSSGQKELVATAIAVAVGCEDCILYHVDGALRHGATEADLVEVLGVAVEMGGGPAVMYASKALDAWRALASEG